MEPQERVVPKMTHTDPVFVSSASGGPWRAGLSSAPTKELIRKSPGMCYPIAC